MKKIISMFILCFVISCVCVCGVNAVTVDDEDIIRPLSDGEAYINGEIRTDLSDIINVGNGYLVYKEENGTKERCFTEDFINFRSVDVFDAHGNTDFYVQGEFTRAGHMDEITWADGVYMARSNVYDNEMYPGRVLESEGYLYILDEDFQYIKRITFASYVREISYVDGTYYVRISNRGYNRAMVWGSTSDDIAEGVYSSTDLENWELEADLKRVPATNGKVMLTMSDDGVYTFKDGKLGNKIIYEEANVDYVNANDAYVQQVLNKAGEYFYVVICNVPEISVWLTDDGVYMTKFVTDISNHLKAINGDIYDVYNKMYITRDDVYRYMQSSNIYVQVDDKILGFSQPPVMEDDRTLVPMRFLFEQLGAEVSWDDTTQSATAQITKDFDESMSDGEFVNIAARERQAEQGLGDVIKDKFSVDYQTNLLSSIVGNNNEGMLNTIPQSATADSVSAPPRSTINDCHRQSSPLYTREPGAGENNIVTFSIDNTTATVNGETKTMDVPARLIGDQTFVPLRFLSENLGYTVTWDDNTNTAKVITK